MQRHEALSAYLEALGLDYGGGPRRVPDCLKLEGRTLTVESWERAIIEHSLNHPEDRSRPWAPLLAEGLAFRAKCLCGGRDSVAHVTATGGARLADAVGPEVAAEPVEATAAADATGETEQLITDAAVGLALLREMQLAVDQLVVAGEASEAKKLTGFRNRVAEAVRQIKEQLGDDAYERAENKSEGMVAPPIAEPLASHSQGQLPASASAAQHLKRGPARRGKAIDAGRSPGVRNKVLLLATLVAVWAVVFLPRLVKQPIPVLEPVDFGQVPGIAAVTARPPSLFVRVDDLVWTQLSAEERRDLVEHVGRIAEGAGYNGAQFLLVGRGQPVARWLRDGGASVTDPS